jgi:hypothetical protein
MKQAKAPTLKAWMDPISALRLSGSVQHRRSATIRVAMKTQMTPPVK